MQDIRTQLGRTVDASDEDGHFDVCWVNTDFRPLEIRRLGLFKYCEDENSLKVWELCELRYPHPTHPEDCSVWLMKWVSVSQAPHTNDSIKFICDAMKGIQGMTVMPY